MLTSIDIRQPFQAVCFSHIRSNFVRLKKKKKKNTCTLNQKPTLTVAITFNRRLRLHRRRRRRRHRLPLVLNNKKSNKNFAWESLKHALL